MCFIGTICDMQSYPFREIEPKWQKYWEDNKTFKVTEDEEFPPEKRQYILDMFPYPSGAGLHVGHPEGYTATDIYSRYLRMHGYNVLHPMGYDSFGLPAENYAIKSGNPPRKITEKNIVNFARQIRRLGFSYDWEREIQTHRPDYYRWTQWIFLQLYKRGLAYESEMPINWCKSCKTGLANEEVHEGKCERCGHLVQRKNTRQWILKITEYAQALLDDLDCLNWTESIKAMQRNWIGRSEGANVVFTLAGAAAHAGSIEVYTTRPDTLFGATYMVLAPEHPLVPKVCTPENRSSVENYIEQASHKSDLERTDLAKVKSGVPTGAHAINPVNGRENRSKKLKPVSLRLYSKILSISDSKILSLESVKNISNSQASRRESLLPSVISSKRSMAASSAFNPFLFRNPVTQPRLSRSDISQKTSIAFLGKELAKALGYPQVPGVSSQVNMSTTSEDGAFMYCLKTRKSPSLRA